MSDSQHDINVDIATAMGTQRPLLRQGAVANFVDSTSPNPFVATPFASRAPACGQKRAVSYGYNASPPALQPAAKRRPIFVTPLAVLPGPGYNMGLTSHSASGSAGSLGPAPASLMYKYSHPTAGPSFSSFTSVLGGEDTDVEGSELSTMPSSPTDRYSYGNSSTSMPILRRRSTDASLIEGLEGAFTIGAEKEEGSNEGEGSPPAAQGGEEEGGFQQVDDSHIPATYLVNPTRGWATPHFATPAVARHAEGIYDSSSPWATYDGYNVGSSASSAVTNPQVFGIERGLSDQIFAQAGIETFTPGQPSKRRPTMSLLHLLSFATGAEGTSLQEFGEMLADCETCNRYAFIENKSDHICIPGTSDKFTSGLTSPGGSISPQAVRDWMFDNGTLSRKDIDSIFGFCTGCLFVILEGTGRDHVDYCAARKALRRHV